MVVKYRTRLKPDGLAGIVYCVQKKYWFYWITIKTFDNNSDMINYYYNICHNLLKER